jgi:hypothetical protein
MNGTNGKTTSDLRRILREGDPAAGEPGLHPEEVRAMRRAVLTAAPEPRRRFLLVPAAAGLIVALGLVVLAVLWWRPVELSAPAREPERRAAVAAPPAREPVPPAAVPQAPEPATEKAAAPAIARKPVRTRQPTVRPAPAPDPPQEREPEPPMVLAQAEPATRQVQFSTPGGTRIIWVLSSDNAL